MKMMSLILFVLIVMFSLTVRAVGDTFIAGNKDITEVIPISSTTQQFYFMNYTDGASNKYEQISYGNGSVLQLIKSVTSTQNFSVRMKFKVNNSLGYNFNVTAQEAKFAIELNAANGNGDAHNSLEFRSNGTYISDSGVGNVVSNFYKINLSDTWHNLTVNLIAQNTIAGANTYVFIDCLSVINTTVAATATSNRVLLGASSATQNPSNATLDIMFLNYSNEAYFNDSGTYCPDKDLNPSANVSFNTTNSLSMGDVLNFSANITDDVGIKFANWTYNLSGKINYINYSFGSGTKSSQVSNTTLLQRIGNVINFTLYVTDSNNHVVQNSTLIFINRTSNISMIPTFSSSSITTSDTAILSINTTDDFFNLTEINFTVRSPDSSSVKYYNRSCIGLSTPFFICNYTFFSGSETSEIGAWNLTKTYILEALENGTKNLIGFFPNLTLSVTSPSSTSSPGGGGGGGSITIFERTNKSLFFKPSLISSNFLYTPFINLNQTFSIEIQSNKPIKECVSSVFECEILKDEVSFRVSKIISDESTFTKSYEDKIKIKAQDDEAKVLNSKLTVINIGYLISVESDIKCFNDNPYIFKCTNDKLTGIRAIIPVGLITTALLFIYNAKRKR